MYDLNVSASPEAPDGEKQPFFKRDPAMRLWHSIRDWMRKRTFAPDWLPGSWRHPVSGYVAAVLLQVLAVIIIWLLISLFPAFEFAGILGVLAIVLVAVNWGIGPGLLATVLGIVLLDSFVLLPHSGESFFGAKNVVEVLFFLVSGCVTSITAGRGEHKAAHQTGEFEAIFESMADGVFVYGSEGSMLRMNAAFRKMVGLKAENERSFFSQSLDERRTQLTMADEFGQPLPFERWPQSRILRGEVLTEANTADVIFHTFDGRILHVNVSGAPVRNADGEPVAALCICRDVTERRRLERRTHDALNALLAMAESLVSLPESVKITGQLSQDASDRIAQKLVELTRDVMGCERVGITVVDPQTQNLRSVAVVGLPAEQELLWRARRPGFHLSDMLMNEAYQQQLLEGEPIILDMTQPPLSQYPNPFDIHRMLLVPMSIDNQLIGLISLDYADKAHQYTQEEKAFASAVARLVTLVFERERLLRERAEARANELALRQANQQMEEFLGMISHELKTPLTSIKGNTQLAVRQLKNSLQSLEKILGLYESAEQQSRRLNRLVDDLLDVSRVQAGYLDLHLAPHDLLLIVRQAVEEQQQVWSDRTITLESGDIQTAPVEVDADRIAQAIMNYLTNALKYSSEDRPVQVRLQEQENEVKVSVRDYGPGISTEQQEYIWERFRRVPEMEIQSRSHLSNAGLGLGLYISKTIIEQHHGQVGVDSIPGEGSTFWFTLPLAPDARGEANSQEES
ncbi:MAG TPA: ATP-binding protein [Ktedonobacteraceae bacterium]|nr:ATP-binding protein [Ktedonobacteraceae bacterium]